MFDEIHSYQDTPILVMYSTCTVYIVIIEYMYTSSHVIY